MRTIIFFILLSAWGVLHAQSNAPNNFNSAIEQGRNSSSDPLSNGIYTCDPRIENGFYCVDVYGRCYDENGAWEAIYKKGIKKYDCSNIVGSIGFAVNSSSGRFCDKFEKAFFRLSPTFSCEEEGIVLWRVAVVNRDIANEGYGERESEFNISTVTRSFQIAYAGNNTFDDAMVANDYFSEDRIQSSVPYFLGTLRLKIKAGAENQTSGLVLVPTACSVGVWDITTDQTNSAASTDNTVIGWLDGKNPDIPLSGETEPQVPDDPVFASGDNSVCSGSTGAYRISEANGATDYDWWVATDAAGNNRVTDSNIASLTKNTNNLGASVNWGNGAAGKTYYVCVQAKNDAGTSGVVSYPVSVGNKPTLNLTANGGTEALGGAYCGGTTMNLKAASSAENGVTYTWKLNGQPITGSSYQLSNYALPNESGTLTFSVEASRGTCTASANLSVTVQPSPVLVMNPALNSSYPNGSVVTLGVSDQKGSRLDSYQWTQPTQSTLASLEVNVDGGNIPYHVTATNQHNCSSSLSGTVNKSSTGGLQAENIDLLFAQSTLCQGGVMPLVIRVSGLSAGTNYTYTWYKGTTSTGLPIQTKTTTLTEDIYAVSEAGDYTVVITTNTGLRLTRTKKVTAAAKSGITVQTEPLIYAVSGTQVVLLAEGQGGNGYSYKWRPVEGLASGESEKQYPLTGKITKQTDYQVYVADGSTTTDRCVATGTTRVDLTSTLPSGNGREYVLNVNPDHAELCKSSDLRLHASVTGSGSKPVSYSWWRKDPQAAGLRDENTAEPLISVLPTSPSVITYYVKATVGTGAEAKVLTKALDFNVNDKTAPRLTTPGLLTVLPGESAVLSAYAQPRETSTCTWHWSGEAAASHLPDSEKNKQFVQTSAFNAGESESFRVYMIDDNGCYSNEATLDVEVKDENAAGGGGFDIDIDAEMDVMCANTSQTLGVSLQPKKSGVTYEWYSVPDLFGGSSHSEHPTIAPNQSGDYQIVVTVTDANGKKNTTVKTITMSTQAPDFKLASPDVCQGGELQASGNGITVNSYKWYVDGVLQEGYTTNKLPSSLLNGTQSVRVLAESSNANCTTVWEGDVTIHDLPTLSWNPALPNSTEAGKSLTVGAVADPSDRNYNWVWSGVPQGVGNNGSYTVTPGADDNYVKIGVTVTDQYGCSSEKLETEDDGIMVEKAMSVEIVQDGVACTGGSVVLKARNIIGAVGPYTYEWKDGSAIIGRDSMLVVAVTGNKSYHLTVRADNNGNEKIKEADYAVTTQSRTAPNITPCPDITIGYEEQAVLTADVTSGGTAPFSWNWRPVTELENAMAATQQSPRTKQLIKDTPYSVYVKDGNGCISQEQTVTVRIDDEFNPQRLAVRILPEKDIWCIGNHAEYAAVVTDTDGNVITSGLTVSWKASNQTIISDGLKAVYQAIQAGSDTIVVVVSNGTVTATAKQIITVKNQRVPSWNLATNEPHCIDSVLKVEVNAGDQIGNYQWFVSKDGGAWQLVADHDKADYTFTEAGSYEVKVVAETAECSLDTLRKTAITIIPIPEVQITIPEECGTAEVVATVTNDTREGYTWEWKNAGTIAGEGDGSKRTFAATEMEQDFEGQVIVRSPEGCPSASKTFNGKVYGLPTMTMSPQTTADAPMSVYPKTEVDLEGRWTSTLPYQLQWYKDGLPVENETSKTMTTEALLMKADPYVFKLEATNTVNTACKREGLIYIEVDPNNFGIEFGDDELTVCQGVEVPFYAKPVNDKNGGLIFTITSDIPNFIPPTTSDGRFVYTFTEPGTYNLHVSVTDKLNNTREASKTIVVKPAPELELNLEFGREYSLCEWGGQKAVELTVSSGTPQYKVNYRWGGEQKELNFNEAQKELFTITGAGEFYLDSLVDINGCKLTYINQGFEVKDDMPKLELSAETVKKCEGGTTDLGITITQGVYPLKLEYQKGAVRHEFTYQSAADRLALTDVGVYTLISLTSENQGCATSLNKTVTVEQFDGATPTLAVNLDGGTLEVCGEGKVEIPITIASGAPQYTITYTKEGDAVEYTFVFSTAGDTLLPVTGSGKFTILKVTDSNGCSSQGGGVAVDVESANPVIHIDSMDFAVHALEPFVLGVQDMDDAFTYSWKKAKVVGDEVIKDFTSAVANGTYSDSLSVDDGDIYYVLQGSSKQLAGCHGWDTVYVYKIPNAPIIEIAAAETPHDLKLTFNVDETEEALVDGYRLMHNKWDGYAIESEYSEKAVRAHDNPIYDLKEADLDTLEFFYVMVSRTIDIRQNGTKKTYFSLPSDTVGYKVDVLYLNSNTENTSNNVISWIFDMPEVKTSADLYERLGGPTYIGLISTWDFEGQGWYKATTYDPMWEYMPDEVEKYQGVFDISIGNAYQVGLLSDKLLDEGLKSIVHVQYGKIPVYFTFDMEFFEGKNNNYISILGLHKIGLKKTPDVFKDLVKENVTSVAIWDFDNQGWFKATTPNPMWEYMPESEPEFENIFNLYLGIPLQINIKNTIQWK